MFEYKLFFHVINRFFIYFPFSEMRCTKCGAKASSLYKQYTKDVLALESCTKCSNDVDPYIEYTEAIKILDLVLFQPEVYRHYFYNQKRSSKTIFKISIISFVVSAFSQLCFAKNFSDFTELTSPLASSASQIFLLSSIFKSALATILFCLGHFIKKWFQPTSSGICCGLQWSTRPQGFAGNSPVCRG